MLCLRFSVSFPRLPMLVNLSYALFCASAFLGLRVPGLERTRRTACALGGGPEKAKTLTSFFFLNFLCFVPFRFGLGTDSYSYDLYTMATNAGSRCTYHPGFPAVFRKSSFLRGERSLANCVRVCLCRCVCM